MNGFCTRCRRTGICALSAGWYDGVMRRELVIEKQRGRWRNWNRAAYLWASRFVLYHLLSHGRMYLLYMKKKRMFLQERHINQIRRLRMENIRTVFPNFTLSCTERIVRLVSLKVTGLCGGDDLTELVRLLPVRVYWSLRRNLARPLFMMNWNLWKPIFVWAGTSRRWFFNGYKDRRGLDIQPCWSSPPRLYRCHR